MIHEQNDNTNKERESVTNKQPKTNKNKLWTRRI